MNLRGRIGRLERNRAVVCPVCDGPDITITWPGEEPRAHSTNEVPETTASYDCPLCGKPDAVVVVRWMATT